MFTFSKRSVCLTSPFPETDERETAAAAAATTDGGWQRPSEADSRAAVAAPASQRTIAIYHHHPASHLASRSGSQRTDTRRTTTTTTTTTTATATTTAAATTTTAAAAAAGFGFDCCSGCNYGCLLARSFVVSFRTLTRWTRVRIFSRRSICRSPGWFVGWCVDHQHHQFSEVFLDRSASTHSSPVNTD